MQLIDSSRRPSRLSPGSLPRRFRGLLRWGLALAAGALALAGGGIEPASAYPQFQFSTYNTRCDLCHYSPTGGGLINGYGRDESSQTISSMGGDGGFLHGLWKPPEWLALGVDLRGAALAKKNSEVPQYLAFPMQADLYTRLAFGSVSLNATVGARGAARPPRGDVLGRLISREHYLMWQTGEIYARAGRFMVPYGLRLQDHSAYIRRYLGQHTLEETYNLSVGKVGNAWEVHFTGFMPPPVLGVGPKATGGAMYYERRNSDETGAYGMQTRVAVTDDDTQYWLGGVGKHWSDEKSILLLSQLDLGLQTFGADDIDPRMQLSAHVSATYFWRQGWMLGTALERYDPDLLLKGTGRDSINLSVQYFPRAHFELMLLGKLEFQGEDYASPKPMGLLMLHYYL